MSIRRAACAVAMIAAIGGATSGCASSLGPPFNPPGHLADLDHPWHAVPYYVGFGVVSVPLVIITSPIAVVVELVQTHHVSPVFDFAFGPGLLFGTAVGGVFFVVGYPLELVVPEHHDPPPVPPEFEGEPSAEVR